MVVYNSTIKPGILASSGGCAYDFCRNMQPSEAMASRRGPIYRAHRGERGNVRMSRPPPCGRDKSGPNDLPGKIGTERYLMPVKPRLASAAMLVRDTTHVHGIE